MKKKTEDLINEIVTGRDISLYIDSNQEEFLDIPLQEHLQGLLRQKKMRVSQAVERACKGEYVYQVFRGVKRPGRDVILCIALALGLDLKETGMLLRIARMPSLDARDRRDSILIFAVSRGLTVPDTNDILYELGESCL